MKDTHKNKKVEYMQVFAFNLKNMFYIGTARVGRGKYEVCFYFQPTW